MLGAEVAVDGNLEEPQAGHAATGGRRSLGLLNAELQRLIQAQEGNVLEPLSSSPSPVSMLKRTRMPEGSMFANTHSEALFC
jgi:hypothetical protein